MDELLQQAQRFHVQGALTEARRCYAQILETQPRHFDALHMLGVIAAQSNDPVLAIELMDRAIEVDPRIAAVHYHRGNALRTLMRYDDALSSYDRAVAIQPDYRGALLGRALTLRSLGRLAEAVSAYDRLIAIDPGHVDALNNRGNLLKECGRLEEALASYDSAIALRPDQPDIHNNRGNLLRRMNRPDEALRSLDKAISLSPSHVDALANRGAVLHELRRLPEAIASYDRAIALRPDHAGAHWNRSLTLLLAGDYGNAWAEHEWRWKTEGFTSMRRNFREPLWTGEVSIAGKTILLHAEQGYGDTIQFCRYAQFVHDRGARVVFEAPRALLRLLRTLQGVDLLVARGDTLPPFDCHCPLVSLPLAFGTTLDTVPRATSYLAGGRKLRAKFDEVLGKKTRPRIGLVWQGNVNQGNDLNRRLPLEILIRHLPDGFDYVCLQKELREADIDLMKARGIAHHSDSLRDFADTAALCDRMDVVVSVCTSVAHLSGALGKRTWVLLSYVADWRWLLDREDSPWYPTAKLYRQAADRKWEPVLERVGEDLKTLARSLG